MDRRAQRPAKTSGMRLPCRRSQRRDWRLPAPTFASPQMLPNWRAYVPGINFIRTAMIGGMSGISSQRTPALRVSAAGSRGSSIPSTTKPASNHDSKSTLIGRWKNHWGSGWPTMPSVFLANGERYGRHLDAGANDVPTVVALHRSPRSVGLSAEWKHGWVTENTNTPPGVSIAGEEPRTAGRFRACP